MREKRVCKKEKEEKREKVYSIRGKEVVGREGYNIEN